MREARQIADHRRIRTWRVFGAVFVASAIGYWLFVGQVSAEEIGLGLCGSGLAALWAATLSGAADIRFRFEWNAVAAVAGAIAGVPRAAARVAWLLIKAGRHRPRGGVTEQKFDHGRDGNPADATRRAAVLLAISLAPDRFVLVHERDRLRVHRLVAGLEGGNAEWPA